MDEYPTLSTPLLSNEEAEEHLCPFGRAGNLYCDPYNCLAWTLVEVKQSDYLGFCALIHKATELGLVYRGPKTARP